MEASTCSEAWTDRSVVALGRVGGAKDEQNECLTEKPSRSSAFHRERSKGREVERSREIEKVEMRGPATRNC